MESEPLLYVKRAGTDFTRNRKLSMSDTIRTITCMHGGSLKKELYDFYKDKTLMTASAFVQQRNKIKPDAFKNLFYRFNQESIGYDTNRFCGCNIFAVDGTALNIPRNPQSETFMPKYGEKGINQFHINALYDVCNKTYKDVVIQPNPQQNENFAAQKMFQPLLYRACIEQGFQVSLLGRFCVPVLCRLHCDPFWSEGTWLLCL